MKKTELRIAIVVSIPRAGEFVVRLPLDLAQYANAPTTEEVEQAAFDLTASRVKIKLVKGEAARVRRAFRARQKHGAL